MQGSQTDVTRSNLLPQIIRLVNLKIMGMTDAIESRTYIQKDTNNLLSGGEEEVSQKRKGPFE